MGDRRYCRLVLGGHVETTEELDALLEAIVYEEWANDVQEAATVLLSFIEGGEEFIDEERNYGAYEGIDGALSAIPSLGACAWVGAGDGPAFIRTWMPNYFHKHPHEAVRIEFVHDCVDGDDPAVSIRMLEQALREPDPLASVKELVNTIKTEGGLNMPPFTVSATVMAMLRINPVRDAA